MAPAPTHSPGIQSVSKPFELLCCFSPDDPEWGVTELAEYLGLCKSAVHRILATCEQYHVVVRTASRRYRLGTRVLEMGNTYRFHRRLLWKAEPTIRRLADETASIAHMGELDGRDVLELMRSSGPGAIMFTRTPRLRASAHTTAMGKVLLALGGEQVFHDFVGRSTTLKCMTPYTIDKPDVLRRNLQAVAEQGYALSDQESDLGCRCLAVPVRMRGREVVAALSVSNTAAKFCEREIPSVLRKLFAAAEIIGRDVPD
ncbi:MAG TPA: IclR family transcriptional regulator [Bryobacteraceae bacterium]|nr:IclR family transcriptional regulator [Bryobacteraceae bacterium]